MNNEMLIRRYQSALTKNTRKGAGRIIQLEQENKQLKEKIEEYKNILKIQNEREYYSKFLKDFQKEKGTNVLPDFDEVYKRYDNYKSILTELEEYCKSWKENEKYCYLASNDIDKCRYDIWGEVLDKIQELKEKYK